jgi:hypothetical protein
MLWMIVEVMDADNGSNASGYVMVVGVACRLTLSK